jgi:glycosyltransferase involved in cell wall biosynthesis
VAFIFDHFGPYHLARISAAAKVPEWDVWGIELHPKSRTYAWDSSKAAFGFHKISLPNVGLTGSAERFALLPHLEGALASCLPDVVFVNGWGDFMSLETIRWAKKQGVRLAVMSETRRVDGERSWWGEWVKSRIVSICDAGFCGGESHRRYLGELGLPKDRVALGYNAVDNEFFAVAKKSGLQDFRTMWPQEDGILGGATEGTNLNATSNSLPATAPEALTGPYFLASNRFVERKNLEQLIRAYAVYVGSLQECKKAWPIVLLGDGDLRGKLEALCGEVGVQVFSVQESVFSREKECDLKLNSYKLKTPAESGCVVFAGFRQVEELPFFYAGAGAFIHPALSEPWGLVINEAMASGLPILSSGNVGAAEELVQEGANGFSFDPDDVEGLAGLMAQMAGMSVEKRLAMGKASERLILEWGPERFARGAQEAVRVAMSAPMKCAGILDRILLEMLIRK